MNMVTKVLSIGALLAVAACAQQSSTPTGDVYALLFVAHTTSTEIPAEQANVVLARPSIFPTLAACNVVRDKLVGETKSADAVKFFTDNKIDKTVVTCVPVKF